MKTAFIGAALACVLATPAFAGITCNLTDTRGSFLRHSYLFAGGRCSDQYAEALSSRAQRLQAGWQALGQRQRAAIIYPNRRLPCVAKALNGDPRFFIAFP